MYNGGGPLEDPTARRSRGRPSTPVDERIRNSLKKYGVVTISFLASTASILSDALYDELAALVESGEVRESRLAGRTIVYYLAENEDKTLAELFPSEVLEQAEAA